MATIYAAETDSPLYQLVSSADSWNKTRHNVAGYSAIAFVNHTLYYHGYVRRYNSTKHLIVRSVMAFDTSGISVAPSEATLKLYAGSATGADVVVVKLNAGATIDLSNNAVAGDFDQIAGFSAGNTMAGNVTDYSARPINVTEGLSAWTNGAYNDLALNSTALSDMASLDVFKLCVVEYAYDYLNAAPTTELTSAAFYGYFTQEAGTSKDPYIDYTPGSSGYGHDVGAVAAASISEVSSVATANIGKIIGVD